MQVVAKPMQVKWGSAGDLTRLNGSFFDHVLDIHDALVSLRVDGKLILWNQCSSIRVEESEDRRTLTRDAAGLHLTLETRIRQDGAALQRRLKIRNDSQHSHSIDWVQLWNLKFGQSFEESHPHFDPFGMQCPISLFLRGAQGGIFAGMENPFFHMSVDPCTCQIWFEPHLHLRPDSQFVTDWAFLGPWRKQGRPVFKALTQAYPLLDSEQEILDLGEINALQFYLKGRDSHDARGGKHGVEPVPYHAETPPLGVETWRAIRWLNGDGSVENGGGSSRELNVSAAKLNRIAGEGFQVSDPRNAHRQEICFANEEACTRVVSWIAQQIKALKIDVLRLNFGDVPSAGDLSNCTGIRECFSSSHDHARGFARYVEWRNMKALCSSLQRAFPHLKQILPAHALRFGPWFEEVCIELEFLDNINGSERKALLELYGAMAHDFSFIPMHFTAREPNTENVQAEACNGVCYDLYVSNGSRKIPVESDARGIQHLFYLGDPPLLFNDNSLTPLDDRIAALDEAPTAIYKQASSRYVVPHDHLLDEASLLEQAAAGVLVKTGIVSVDALIWEDGGTRFHESIRSFEGWNTLARREISALSKIIAAHPDQLLLARSYQDLERAQQTGRSAVLIGFEGGKPIEGSLEKLREFYELGLRQLQFTWAFRNQISDAQEESEDGGLTPFGRELIREINRLGIIGDLTHISRRAFLQVLELSDRPVIASHSSSFSFCADPGNLDDELMKALAAQGGVAGVHFCSHIVKAPNCYTTMEDVLDHVCAMVDLVGVDHVGLGCDFLPYDESYRKAQETFMKQTDARGRERVDLLAFVQGLGRIGQLGRLDWRLRARGFHADEVEKIMGENWLRIYRQVLV